MSRVLFSDLEPGERYFAVFTPTGHCVYRTRSEDEAREMVGRNPDRLTYGQHLKAAEKPPRRSESDDPGYMSGFTG